MTGSPDPENLVETEISNEEAVAANEQVIAERTGEKEDVQKNKDDSADETDRASVLKAVEEKVTFDKYPEDEVASYIQSMVSNVRSAADNYGIDIEAYMKYFYGYEDEASFLEYLHKAVPDVCPFFLRRKFCQNIIRSGEGSLSQSTVQRL